MAENLNFCTSKNWDKFIKVNNKCLNTSRQTTWARTSSASGTSRKWQWSGRLTVTCWELLLAPGSSSFLGGGLGAASTSSMSIPRRRFPSNRTPPRTSQVNIFPTSCCLCSVSNLYVLFFKPKDLFFLTKCDLYFNVKSDYSN